VSRADAKDTGDELEQRIVDADPALEAVPDQVADWYDAQTTTLLEATAERPMGGILLVVADRPVEIKTCRVWIGNGSGARCRGRWYIKQQAHERLLDAGGVYYLAEYDVDDDGERTLQAELVVPAGTVDDLRGSWCDSGRQEGAVARLSWGDVIRADALEDTGGVPA